MLDGASSAKGEELTPTKDETPGSHSPRGSARDCSRTAEHARQGYTVTPAQSTWGGSYEVRANLAAGAALKHGATPLGALIVGHIASRGAHCWETDSRVAEQITQRTGRQPHPRSVARSRRMLTRAGLIASKRVFTGQRLPKEARNSISAHGTTVKRPNWEVLGVKDPIGKKRERGTKSDGRVTPRARHAATSGLVPRHAERSRPPVDAELAAAMGELETAMQSRWDADDAVAIEHDREAYAQAVRQRGPPK